MKYKNRKHSRLGIYFLALPCLLLLFSSQQANGEAISGFVQASKQNSRLQNELNWTFGGRTQRGWALYVPLIQRTIQSSSNVNSEEFAAALSSWQKDAGLSADGILDYDTWMKMVSNFQSERRARIEGLQAKPELETVSSKYFYDVQRPEELRQVSKEALAAYHRMVAAAVSELSPQALSSGKWLKIISAYRTPEYQAELRRRNPNASRAALGINSPHFTGRALDLYVGGMPVSTDDRNRAVQINTEVYRWLVNNADRFGFKPYFYEPWHWEYNPDRTFQLAAANGGK